MREDYETAYYALYVHIAGLYDRMRLEYPEHKKDRAWMELLYELFCALMDSDFAAEYPDMERAEWELRYRELKEKSNAE